MEQICLMGLNRALHIRMGEDDIGFVSSSSSSTSVLLSDTGSSHLKLRHVTIDDVRYFNAIPVERLTSICIRFATELESLSEVRSRRAIQEMFFFAEAYDLVLLQTQDSFGWFGVSHFFGVSIN